ncbi:LysR substrate-binding domain-containing protein [Salinisphaera orenii]|uniref:LysR family transcriptional regulator n=1 Tax=Salinisphaera orenii YIM 95161 TaxID=1051139 RepID=A0A423PTT3_9GAMM|nr:LysR substrate-binding domain-containing protein [Salinisphaera halophila]ROO28978.1 LysR family transcriptional regulator [Salinisphaera halophila YIM 95161]
MIHSPIKLRHLVAFQEVARLGRIKSAAEALSITQPGISKTLRELEESLGVKLFERLPRGVRLTPAGRTLLRHAAPALRSLREGIDAIRQDTVETVVRLGALSNVEGGLLPEVLYRLHARQPDLRMEVDTGTSAALLARLRLGELDLVLGRMSEAEEIRDLQFQHLYYEPLIAVVRRDHPLLTSSHAPDTPALMAYPWVVPPRGTTLREQLERFWVEQAAEPPRLAVETLSLPLSTRYALMSDAVWITPQDTAREAIAAGTLVRLAQPIEARGGSVGYAVNTSQPTPRAVEDFCDCLRDVAAAYPVSYKLNNL